MTGPTGSPADPTGGRSPAGSTDLRARVRLLGKPGCHLCDDAREVVARVCADVGAGWVEQSILDDADLMRRYGEYIPVVFVDGVQHDFWRVSADRLRDALRPR